MKSIINRKVYDTEKAEWIASYDNGYARNDLFFCREDLYRKENGEFFLLGDGGAMTRYSKTTGNSTCGTCVIVKLTRREAEEWAEAHMSADDYLKYFEVEED